MEETAVQETPALAEGSFEINARIVSVAAVIYAMLATGNAEGLTKQESHESVISVLETLGVTHDEIVHATVLNIAVASGDLDLEALAATLPE